MEPERFAELRGKCPQPPVIGEWLTEALDEVERLQQALRTNNVDIILESEQTRLNQEVKRLNSVRLEQQREIKRLQAGLQKTKDGVYVVPGDVVWHRGEQWAVVSISDTGTLQLACWKDKMHRTAVFGKDCYSTLEALNHAMNQASIDTIDEAAEANPE